MSEDFENYGRPESTCGDCGFHHKRWACPLLPAALAREERVLEEQERKVAKLRESMRLREIETGRPVLGGAPW